MEDFTPKVTVTYQVESDGELHTGDQIVRAGLSDREYVLIGRGLMFEDNWCGMDMRHAIGVQRQGEMERFVFCNLDGDEDENDSAEE